MATEIEQQQSRLKELIAKGKEQGFLTYAEVNDHLPDDISDTDQIEDIIRPCGLAPAKSNNISKLSQILVEEHDGAVAETLEELEALPGVGHKTAQVVVAQAFGQPAFPVDTHIHRLA